MLRQADFPACRFTFQNHKAFCCLFHHLSLQSHKRKHFSIEKIYIHSLGRQKETHFLLKYLHSFAHTGHQTFTCISQKKLGRREINVSKDKTHTNGKSTCKFSPSSQSGTAFCFFLFHFVSSPFQMWCGIRTSKVTIFIFILSRHSPILSGYATSHSTNLLKHIHTFWSFANKINLMLDLRVTPV